MIWKQIDIAWYLTIVINTHIPCWDSNQLTSCVQHSTKSMTTILDAIFSDAIRTKYVLSKSRLMHDSWTSIKPYICTCIGTTYYRNDINYSHIWSASCCSTLWLHVYFIICEKYTSRGVIRPHGFLRYILSVFLWYTSSLLPQIICFIMYMSRLCKKTIICTINYGQIIWSMLT